MNDREPERTLQRYKLLEEVGQGGMAVVYKGLDTTLNREVAVKVLHPHLAGVAESRARLQREAHAVAKLRHENILEIFDYSGPDSPESYIVTEFIHGRTLKNFLVENPLPFPEVAEMVVSEVARALEHAHQLGVIHRDIKPENVMIRDDGLLKLMDFGIAQIVDKERMTVTGQLLGSPAYMAPEHVEGRPLDFRTDVFAVGILLYQLATGQLPFRGKNPHEVLKRIAECKYTPAELVNPLIGARLGRVIAKALEREPAARFPDVTPLRKELLEDLADAGVEDSRKELQGFFADPKGWTAAFRPRLVQALAKRGRELEQRGRTAAALELWSRALAVDPKSKELRALVDGMARRRRAVRVLVALSTLGVVGAGSALGVSQWRKHIVTAPPPTLEAKVTPPPAPKAKPVERPSRPPEERPHPRPHPPPLVVAHPRPAPETAPPVVEKPASGPARILRVRAQPQGELKIALDDGAPVDYDPSREWTLPADAQTHVFHFSGPFVVSDELRVAPGEAGEKKIRLKWKPGRISVKAIPDVADVMVEDNPPIRSGDAVDLLFPLSSSGRREVTVRVTAPGYRTQTLQIPLHAGGAEERTVELKKLGD